MKREGRRDRGREETRLREKEGGPKGKYIGLKLVDMPVFWPQASQRRSCLLQIFYRDFNPVPSFLDLKHYRKKSNDLLG